MPFKHIVKNTYMLQATLMVYDVQRKHSQYRHIRTCENLGKFSLKNALMLDAILSLPQIRDLPPRKGACTHT